MYIKINCTYVFLIFLYTYNIYNIQKTYVKSFTKFSRISIQQIILKPCRLDLTI